MTKEERINFIKNKMVPLFTGMNADDAFTILQETHTLVEELFFSFNLYLDEKKLQST